MYGFDILHGIYKGTFEIPCKISYPYIERCDVIRYWKFKCAQSSYVALKCLHYLSLCGEE